MKILKIIVITLLTLMVLALIAAATAPDNITISSNITINAPASKIFRNVIVLKKWKLWSPFEHDSTMTDSFSGPDSGVGASRSWQGKIIGKGKMTIVEAEPYTHIKNHLDFGPKGDATGNWSFIPVDSAKTKVIWSTHIGGLTFPFERLLGKVLEPMMKPMFDKGLEDLKTYLETGKTAIGKADSTLQNIPDNE